MKNSTYWLVVAVLLVMVLIGGGMLAYPYLTQEAEEPTTQVTTVPETQAATESENAAPDFTVYDIDGNAVRLSDFRGKPVVLNFWASWCGPCKSEMPDFNEAYEKYGDQIQFMMVNLTDGTNETLETASALIGEQGYSFPVYYDTDMEAATVYQIYSIPMTCLIDGNGDLIDLNIGMMSAEELEQAIGTILPE